MKKTILSICLLSGITSFGQVINDQVSVQPGYANQVYYSLENGEVANISNQDWDLAFDLGGFGTGIRANSQMGTNVFVADNDTTNWSTIDTSGIASWSPLYNSDMNWTAGALNADFDPSNQSDIGWGLYNSTTHHIIGNKIFVVQFLDGSIKKVWIQSLISGSYTFRIADLDNTNDITQVVTKNDYSDKNFIYYSIANNTILDREPVSADWDIVFTKYLGELAPGVHYGVTGGLTNYYTEVYEATGDIAGNLEFDNTYTFSSEINTIGYDWKSYSFSAGGYILADSTAYFIKTVQDDYWKVIFTGFEGSATGNIMFSKEKIGAASINNNNLVETNAYPNPTNGTLRISSSETLEIISLFNTSGQLIFSTNEINTVTDINLEHLPNGIYLLKTQTINGGIATEKIVKL